MQGKKPYQEKLFVSFQLSNAVPSDNIYRRLGELVDFSFLYKSTAKYYSEEGQKSIDPVVFMKLMLVGYLENLNSDRRIVSMSKMRLDILYFIGYDIDEELPWHSTLSRTRQLYGQEVFTEMFKRILKQCIDKGMVSGRRQAIDGVYVKANASLDSMVERDILDDVATFGQELFQNEDEKVVPVAKIKARHDHDELPPKKNPSNGTHFSPSDPDAKMSVKPGKATALNYLGQVCVDTASHTITHIQAFTAEKRDSQCLPEVLKNLVSNLTDNDVRIEEVVADRGYSSGEAIKALEKNNIIGYIPNRGQFIAERSCLTYIGDGDYYRCSNNKILSHTNTFKNFDYSSNKEYSITRKACKDCPFKYDCHAYGTKLTRVIDSIDKPYYRKMHERMQTKKAKILMKKRQSTVEPVIGSLINYYGMKKVNTKGLVQANKCLTIAAMAYNLKKMLNHKMKVFQSQMVRLEQTLKNGIYSYFSSSIRCDEATRLWNRDFTPLMNMLSRNPF